MSARRTPDVAIPSVLRFRDPDALARAVADEVAELLGAAVGARGRASFALSGGTTPERLFRELAGRGPGALPWERIDLWWSDERVVPPSHPDSNYRMALRALIEPLGLSAARVHRVAGELDAEEAADAYQAELLRVLGDPPALDLVLLGLGADGHTASLFPGAVSPEESTRWVMAARAPGAGPARVTLTPRALNAARHLRFLVAGAPKAAAVAAALEGPRDPDRQPVHRIAGGDVGWRIDDAAAAGRPAGRRTDD